MKTKLVLIILVATITNSCRSKLKITEYSKGAEIERIQTDTNKVVSIKEDLQAIKQSEKDVILKHNQNAGEIQINGKTDSANNFTYYNVQNGDTLQAISINGNADFIFRNKWNQEDKKETVKEKTEEINKVAKVARKAVSQKMIKEIAKEAKNVNTEVKSTGFPFNIYVCGLIVVIVLILIWYFRNLIGGYIPDFIKKMFKNGQSNETKD